jgi:hypothetical protein
VVGELLDANTITLDLTFLLEADEVGHNVLGETVLTGHEHLLATSELETGAAEGLLGELNILLSGTDGDEGLANVNAGALNVRLTESVTHTLLESISTSAREHLVDADSVPGVGTDANVEAFLTSLGDHVLVSSDTGGLEGLGGDHFLLLGDEMDAAREIVPLGFLLTTVIDADLGVGHTTVVARLGVRLVLLVSVAASGASSHFIIKNNYLAPHYRITNGRDTLL